jgi:hypothetical protein
MAEKREAVQNLAEQPDWAPVDAVATLVADEKFYDAIKANEREQDRWRGCAVLTTPRGWLRIRPEMTRQQLFRASVVRQRLRHGKSL